MAISVNKKNLDRKIRRLLSNVNDRQTFLRIGFFVIKTIKERTRDRGKGVKTAGGRESSLKNVSKEWAERRLRFQRHPKAATGRKSNLTFKGTMLDSIIVKRANKNGIFLGFRNVKQEEKAEGQASQGRVFMNLSKKEILSASEFIKKEILKGQT